MSRDRKFTSDVFLSHHGDDAAKAGKLAERFRSDGLSVKLPAESSTSWRRTTHGGDAG